MNCDTSVIFPLPSDMGNSNKKETGKDVFKWYTRPIQLHLAPPYGWISYYGLGLELSESLCYMAIYACSGR